MSGNKGLAHPEPGELLRLGLQELDISLNEEPLEKLLVYVAELEKWNRRVNLVARKTSIAEIVEKHFLDSLTLLPFIDRQGSPPPTLMDVGTGAGFPGLVLAAALPDLRVILVEPRLKRVSFLRHIVRTLALPGVEIVARRLEEVPELRKKNIEYVTSRAVAEPAVFLPMVAPFLEHGASVLLMLGRDQAGQWNTDSSGQAMLTAECRNYILPFSGAKRTVCKVRHR